MLRKLLAFSLVLIASSVSTGAERAEAAEPPNFIVFCTRPTGTTFVIVPANRVGEEMRRCRATDGEVTGMEKVG